MQETTQKVKLIVHGDALTASKFAAGDVCFGNTKQAASAVGATAALVIREYLHKI